MTEALWSVAQAAAILAASWFVGGWLSDVVGALLGQTRLDRMVRTLLVRLTKPLVMLVAIAAALSQMGVAYNDNKNVYKLHDKFNIGMDEVRTTKALKDTIATLENNLRQKDRHINELTK